MDAVAAWLDVILLSVVVVVCIVQLWLLSSILATVREALEHLRLLRTENRTQTRNVMAVIQESTRVQEAIRALAVTVLESTKERAEREGMTQIKTREGRHG